MKKISNEEYYDLFCQWQDSGLSKAGFAAQRGIPKTTIFHNLIKRMVQTGKIYIENLI